MSGESASVDIPELPQGGDLDVGGGSPSEADAFIGGASQEPPASIPAGAGSYSLTDHYDKLHALKISDHELDLKLKSSIGTFARRAVVGQLIVTNFGFAMYFICTTWGLHSEIPESVIIAWLTTTVVEIVGITLVVTKYLFPESGNNWNHERH